MSPPRTIIVSWLLSLRPAFAEGRSKKDYISSSPGSVGRARNLASAAPMGRSEMIPSGENEQVQGLTGQQRGCQAGGHFPGRPSHLGPASFLSAIFQPCRSGQLPRDCVSPCSACVSQSCFLCVWPSHTFPPSAPVTLASDHAVRSSEPVVSRRFPRFNVFTSLRPRMQAARVQRPGLFRSQLHPQGPDQRRTRIGLRKSTRDCWMRMRVRMEGRVCGWKEQRKRRPGGRRHSGNHKRTPEGHRVSAQAHGPGSCTRQRVRLWPEERSDTGHVWSRHGARGFPLTPCCEGDR